MARAALPGRLTWQIGTVVELIDETPRVKTITLDVPDWQEHRPGEHVDVRLTAEDGYQAERSYSIASAPEDEHLALTIERLDDGEVSPYLTDELRPGDELELRGPIGGYFIWDESIASPPLMLAGGSGLVPFRSILRHWAAGSRRLVPQLVYSARSFTDLIYRDELSRFTDQGVDVQITLTREWPDDWTGHRGRVDRELLQSLDLGGDPIALVCGSNGFVETVSGLLVGLGQPSSRIRTERFGPSG
jgi:ferredoxin-NADP reductase